MQARGKESIVASAPKSHNFFQIFTWKFILVGWEKYDFQKGGGDIMYKNILATFLYY